MFISCGAGQFCHYLQKAKFPFIFQNFPQNTNINPPNLITILPFFPAMGMSNFLQTKTILISVFSLYHNDDSKISFYFPETSFQTIVRVNCSLKNRN